VRVSALRRAIRPPGAVSRRPVRLRLTLIYTSLFLLGGVVLLGTAYGLVAGNLATKTPIAAQSSAPAKAPFASSTLARQCKSGHATAAEEATCQNLAAAAYKSGKLAGAAAARNNVLSSLLYTSLAALGLTAVLSAGLGWTVAGRALRPVHTITAAARRASEENLGDRIALTGPPDELKELADTFDGMLARLDAAFDSQRRFVASASHELRTPLTVMRTAIDVTLAKPERTAAQLEAMAVEVRQAAERAEALIEALLTLARSDRGPGPRSPLDVAVLAEDALDATAPRIREAALRVTATLEAGPATGDPVLAERLVANLIDNAIQHNVAGGWIDVSTGRRDGMAFITVANGGPAIEEADVATIFEPFRRLAQAGPGRPDGVGLGLPIVRSVVAAHNGKVAARPGADGGLEITIWLPAGLPGRQLTTGSSPGGCSAKPGHGSMSSATRRSSWATCLASLASGCLPRR
jgi:signal transduction histidine kinase